MSRLTPLCAGRLSSHLGAAGGGGAHRRAARGRVVVARVVFRGDGEAREFGGRALVGAVVVVAQRDGPRRRRRRRARRRRGRRLVGLNLQAADGRRHPGSQKLLHRLALKGAQRRRDRVAALLALGVQRVQRRERLQVRRLPNRHAEPAQRRRAVVVAPELLRPRPRRARDARVNLVCRGLGGRKVDVAVAQNVAEDSADHLLLRERRALSSAAAGDPRGSLGVGLPSRRTACSAATIAIRSRAARRPAARSTAS